MLYVQVPLLCRSSSTQSIQHFRGFLQIFYLFVPVQISASQLSFQCTVHFRYFLNSVTITVLYHFCTFSNLLVSLLVCLFFVAAYTHSVCCPRVVALSVNHRSGQLIRVPLVRVKFPKESLWDCCSSVLQAWWPLTFLSPNQQVKAQEGEQYTSLQCTVSSRSHPAISVRGLPTRHGSGTSAPAVSGRSHLRSPSDTDTARR